MQCAQCGEKPHACRFDATCDLRPLQGYRSPCMLKERKREEVERALGHPVKPWKPKQKRKKSRNSTEQEKAPWQKQGRTSPGSASPPSAA